MWVQPTVRIALRMVFALVYSVLRLLLDVADVRLRVGVWGSHIHRRAGYSE